MDNITNASGAAINSTTKSLLDVVSDWNGKFTGAYNIRQDGGCAGRRSTDHIKIDSKLDKPGLDITVLPGTKGETVSIPACVSHGGVDDLVYNDFFIGEGADVTIMAGCGVHTDDGQAARHNGIHRFFLEKDSHVKYVEKHIGTGGEGTKTIDPVTQVTLEQGSTLEMDTVQLGGVDSTLRKTSGVVGAGARLIIRERILTEKSQKAVTDFSVELNGEDSGVDLISRSVARGNSHQEYHSKIIGNARCTGHSECDAIIAENGTVNAAPELTANCEDAALIHEAAIGKIAGEQLLKLCTLGLTQAQAEAKIISGFLK